MGSYVSRCAKSVVFILFPSSSEMDKLYMISDGTFFRLNSSPPSRQMLQSVTCNGRLVGNSYEVFLAGYDAETITGALTPASRYRASAIVFGATAIRVSDYIPLYSGSGPSYSSRRYAKPKDAS